MSVVAEEICRRATAIAPKLQHNLATAATTEGADVYAHRERQPVGESLQGPEREIARLSIGDQVVKIVYLRSSVGAPSWVKLALQSLVERWGKVPGWDSYNAKPTEAQYAVQLLKYLSELLRDDAAAPVITPLSDGGVQAEWHGNNEDFEIVVPADDAARYYYYNAATQEEEDRELHVSQFEHVRTLIERF